MKRKKCYLLHNDGHITKTKKPLAELISSPLFSSVRYCMIPIVKYKGIYMAVAGDFLRTFEFTHAKIAYHMRLMGGSDYINDILVDKKRIDACDDSDDILPLYDYGAMQIECTTIEDLYNALHQFFVFSYVENCWDMSEHTMYQYTYMQIADMEIRVYKDKLLMSTTAYHAARDIPFQASANNSIARVISEHFGLLMNKNRRIFSMPRLIFYHDERHIWKWAEHSEPVQLSFNVTHVCPADHFSNSYLIMEREDYDVALRMENANLYMVPIDVHGYESPRFGHPWYLLTPTTHFQLQRFEFRYGDGPEESKLTDLFDLLQPIMIDTFMYEYTDSEDIMFALAYFQVLADEMIEFARGCAAQQYDTYIDEQAEWCTAIMEFKINLDDVNSDNYLEIVTDAMQPHLPTLDEVCILLDLEENTQ